VVVLWFVNVTLQTQMLFGLWLKSIKKLQKTKLK
jgi:hypothetical protein